MKKKMIILSVLICIMLIAVAIVIYKNTNTPETYTVTFMDIDGVYYVENNISSDTKVEEPATPTKEGYAFMGWYLEDEEYDFNSSVNSDLYLKSKWVNLETNNVEEISEEKNEEIKKQTTEKNMQEATINDKKSSGTNTDNNTNPIVDNNDNKTDPANTVEPVVYISFDKGNYSCEAGKTIYAIIKRHDTNPIGNLTYSSTDDKIATIEKSTDLMARCVDCATAQINCKSEGEVTITATLDAKTKAEAKVSVNGQSVITCASTCKKGETISASIKVPGLEGYKSFASSDTSILTITESATQPKCLGCRNLDVKCENVGTASIDVILNSGEKVSKTITVTD